MVLEAYFENAGPDPTIVAPAPDKVSRLPRRGLNRDFETTQVEPLAASGTSGRIRFCTELHGREFEPLVVREIELTAFPKRLFAPLDGGPIGPLRNRSAFVRLRLG